jgi:integrase
VPRRPGQCARKLAEEAGEDPEKATWTRVALHEGRHSAASAFIASGLDPVRVATWLGHSETSTTLDVYSKAFEARERQDAEKVESFYAEAVEVARAPRRE